MDCFVAPLLAKTGSTRESGCGGARAIFPSAFPLAMFRSRALAELRSALARPVARRAVVGFDGFVDTIVSPVGLRRGQGENFTPIATIPEFAQRIAGAAGKSANYEFYPRLEKLGGNAPIMANALVASGTAVTMIGALGRPQVHAVFAELAARAKVVALCAPASTTAVEFDDGKLMFGQMRSLDEITYEQICATMGEAAFLAELSSANLIALVNWTMVPNMTAVYDAVLSRALPKIPAASSARTFFFDLADPEKRSPDDLRAALASISRFEKFGRVTLGLNLKEAQQVAAALGLAATAEDEAGLRAMSDAIRVKLAVATVVVHPRESAACATAAGTWWIPGPYTTHTKITTGAGDHFNAGFATAQLLGLTPEACLALGVATSGHYVRTAASPTLADLETFLANWR